MNAIGKALTKGMVILTALGGCSTIAGAQSTVAAPSAAAPPAATSPGAPPLPVRQPPILEAMMNGLKSPDGTKGIDSVMYIADFPPGSVSARHSHPGWEFNYIIKGAITFEVVGKQPFTLKAGQGMYNQRGNVHTVKNASQTEPAQLVSVLVKDVGAPIAINAF